MGHRTRYQILRREPLSLREILAIQEIVRQERSHGACFGHVAIARVSRSDDLIVDCSVQRSRSRSRRSATTKPFEDLYPTLVCIERGITALTRIVGGEVRVYDDYGTYGWDDANMCLVSGQCDKEYLFFERTEPVEDVERLDAEHYDFQVFGALEIGTKPLAESQIFALKAIVSREQQFWDLHIRTNPKERGYPILYGWTTHLCSHGPPPAAIERINSVVAEIFSIVGGEIRIADSSAAWTLRIENGAIAETALCPDLEDTSWDFERTIEL